MRAPAIGGHPFYNDTSILWAFASGCFTPSKPVIQSSTNGREGGALWPIDLTEEDRRGMVARRRAMERLTGTLLSVPIDFY